MSRPILHSADAAVRPAPARALSVSVVIPCLNEVENIADCVDAARTALRLAGLSGEVIVVDNGSTDGSGSIAEEAGARVVHEPRRGYGAALRAGFAAAAGGYVVMADADGTYDFGEIPRFVAELDAGADVVVGDRLDNVERGAMPRLNRIGNAALSRLLNIFFRTGVRDAHCGMRALRSDVLQTLELQTIGMEFASEMVIRAGKAGLRVREIPITYRLRRGQSKLSILRDGWRHLRLLLVYAPLYLFLLPGALMTVLGLGILVTTLTQVELFGRQWHLHTMVGGSLSLIAGVQILCLGLCAHAYGAYFMGEKERWFARMRRRFRLEHGLALGGVLILAGLVLGGIVVVTWARRGFASLSEERMAVLASTLVIIGLQVVFSSFLLSILGLRRRN